MQEPGGALAADLRAAVRGAVGFSAAARALYAVDASVYRQMPIGVVRPHDDADVLAALEVCRRHDVAVLPRGAGTSEAGQSCNEAVVLDFSRHMDQVVAIDPERGLAEVQPGCVLDRLREAAEPHGLTFGPDPSTHRVCTLGGMIGNNSCGVHSVMAGTTVRNVEALDVVTYRGARLRLDASGLSGPGGEAARIGGALTDLAERAGPLVRARYPNLPRRVSGYNLDELLPERGANVARALVGTEGTCAIVLGATVRLVPSPPGRALLVLGFPDVADAADAVPEILAHGPIAVEGLDDRLVEAVRRRGLSPEATAALPAGGGWLFVEFGGPSAEAAVAAAERARRQLARPPARVIADRREAQGFWRIREAALGATARAPGRGPAFPGWEDSAVPPARMGTYLRELRRLLDAHGLTGAFYGHFGDGCLHTQTDFELRTPAGVRRFRAFVEAAADLVVGLGGSLSGEHGDGQARGELLVRMFGPELVDAFRTFKAVWDPDRRMNPGKVVDPRPLDANLRLRAVRPAMGRVRSPFRLADDGGRLAVASQRCVGVGACTRTAGGTMCPSYQVTREERHSTRGRAHLLFEMLETGAVPGGWRSADVKAALDLCLSCKACRAECPAGVDMATYKAEFLARHYAGRLRPRSAYALGLLPVWAAGLAVAPRPLRAALGSSRATALLSRLAGLAPERRVPALAPRTFRSWFATRPAPQAGGETVLLFVDTFSDQFRPATAQAAVRVLEQLGCRVTIPTARLCCGRPLYDQGMLGAARRRLEALCRHLAPAVAAGVPIVGLEPGCLSVFRDELPNLLGPRGIAGQLAERVQPLADFVAARQDRAAWRPAGRSALLQPHCHRQAVFGPGPDRDVLAAAGITAATVDGGCCGMAGGFGYLPGEPHAVSVALAERQLLPAVRRASASTLVVADGFSCREQIEQQTGRRTLHLAEALQLSLPPG